ncbi:MAG: phosphoglucosamine mutase, partial [Planctomycetaceae bacterium]
GDGLDPEFLTRFALAVGTLADGGTVIVSRDGRSSGEMVRQAVLSGLTACGCRVVDAGIASTPTCGVLVDHLNAAGGVQITASHNPAQWNGLKPFSSRGSVFNAEEGRRLIDLLESGNFRLAAWNEIGAVELLEDPSAPHLQRVLALVDLQAIRRRRLKVVLDCNHGSGAVLGPRLLETWGCEVHVLGGMPDGRFEHPPEPLQENLTNLCDAVRRAGADVGFAQDPDADRLAIVDETGRYIGEELTLALAADFVLPRRPGPFVVNGSTSRVNADVAARHGCAFHRSYVGEANVVAKMLEVSAVLGGEGNGGVIEPRVGMVRDSFVAMAYILAGLTETHRTVSAWADSLPRYVIIKDKLVCPRERVAAACAALKQAYPEARAEEGDGLRLDWPESWVQVRASNTEPILRVIAEAPDGGRAIALCRDAMQIVESAVE